MKNQLLTVLATGLLAYLPASAQLNYTQVNHSGLTAVTFEMGYTEIEIGDIDGDGDLDIVTIGDHGSPNINATEGGIMVFKNNGTGLVWSMSKSGAFGYGGIALGDVNNDGKMDVGYAMHHNYASTDFGDQLIEVALGNGSGTSWTPYDDGLATNGETYGMFGVDFADVNNDGLLDLASNSFGCCSGIHVYKNNGNGTWTQTDGANAGNSYEWVKFGDFNNDGKVDLATSNELGFIWKNDGTGNFASFETGFTNDWYNWMDIADINNDGGKDIAIINSNGAAQAWTFDASVNTWKSISAGLPVSGAVGVEAYDMDMDGNVDLVVWSPGSITIYKGDGAGNWSLAGTVTITETQLSSFATGDFDHDGYGDIAYMARTSTMNADNYLRVYLHSVDNPSLAVLPVSPKGFECFMPGSVQFMNWNSSVPTSGPAATVTIEFSSTGNAGPWTPVVTNAPNSGTYQWTVPAVNSPNCYLRFTISNGSATQAVVTGNPFGIGSCSTPPTSVADTEINLFGFNVFPNPMISSGFVRFRTEGLSAIKLSITDILGKEIDVIMDSEVSEGEHLVRMPVEHLRNGIYFCVLQTGDLVLTRKIMIGK